MTSGLVRKIDDLGRIVIPKELRKTLNIKSDDDIEISAEEDKIILKKYYRLQSLSNIMNEYIPILEKNLECSFLITDTEKILTLSKKLQRKVDNLSIGVYLQELLKNRKSVLENKNKELKINNSLTFNKYYYFSPIIANTDFLGSIILLSDIVINEKEILVLDIVMQIIKKKIEF